MTDVVVVDAVRTPFGRRGGAYASAHSIHVLGDLLKGLLERNPSVHATDIGQVVAGCVGQAGMQASNIGRGAWLAAGLPVNVPAVTVDSQCGSSQQAANVVFALIAAGVIDSAIACGVELMSQVPMGATVPKDGSLGKPITRRYWEHHEFTTQFEGAERIAEQWGISRDDCDRFAKQSQDRAAVAVREGRFDSQLVSIDLPEPGENNKATLRITKDEALRETTLEGLAKLKPTGRPDGVHTAGSSSQIADGASALLMMSADRARELRLAPLAQVVDSCLVGSDPVLMLTGPIPATKTLLTRNGLTIADIDVVEINEAFASVVLAWQQELGADLSNVNPNGGAIALGHPLGGTGTALITKAVHELHRNGGTYGLVTMCCGGGLGTGTLLRKL
ncbi:MAG: acetyl-CoA C-acyltransferase [Acidimicrobiales bacterium]